MRSIAALVFLTSTAAALAAPSAAPPATPAASATAAPAATPLPHWAAEVPFTSCDGLICLGVTTDDGRRLTLLLDTGNVSSYVATDTARASGWKVTPYVGRDGKPVDGISKTGKMRLHLGAVSLDAAMLVFDRKNLGPGNIPFDGGLVFTAFGDRTLQIDFPHHLLRISEVETGPQGVRQPGTLRRITFGKQGPPILTGGPFTVNGKPLQAQIDTAYTGTMLIYDDAIAKLGLSAVAKAGVGHGQTFPYTDGGVTMLAAPATSVGFASRTLDNHSPTLFFPTPGVHQPDGLFEATVGTAFFRASILTLDLHAMTFDVQPASASTGGA